MNKVKKIIFERDGKEFFAYPATKEDFEKVKDDFIAKGLSIDNCNCGQDVCDIYGYWWICTTDLNNNCVWFRSDWRCNP